MGSIGCGGLGVAGAGGDSVIKIVQTPISNSVFFPDDVQQLTETISQSVSVNVS
jgi:hypothetical protein